MDCESFFVPGLWNCGLRDQKKGSKRLGLRIFFFFWKDHFSKKFLQKIFPKKFPKKKFFYIFFKIKKKSNFVVIFSHHLYSSWFSSIFVIVLSCRRNADRHGLSGPQVQKRWTEGPAGAESLCKFILRRRIQLSNKLEAYFPY
jgi:hypothetical protein